MPQVDLETLVSVCGGGGSDRKIACETVADVSDDLPEQPDVPDTDVDVAPDFPPESFWLSKDAEFDWFDRNAFYERKDSTKGNSNSTNLNPNVNPNSTSNSQRFSLNLKSKASIIGLPKTQKTNYVDANRRNCKPPNVRLFPKRSASIGKSAVPVAEPTSPKVSCMGRVRSKRGRRRSSEQPKRTGKKEEKPRKIKEQKKTGLYSRFAAIFRSGHRRANSSQTAGESNGTIIDSLPPRQRSKRGIPASDEPVVDPPGLGGIKRFVSGRRSESWGAEDIDVARAD